MDDRDRSYCEQAIADGEKALDYYRRVGPQWTQDDMAVDAIMKRVESFCEYVVKVSDEEQARHPAFPWRQVQGIRNRLAHDYHGIKIQIVQEALDEYLPRDLTAIKSWLA